MRKYCAICLLLAVVGPGLSAARAGGAEVSVDAPPALPELDIVGNVRRMLETSNGAAAQAEPVAGEAPEIGGSTAHNEPPPPPVPRSHGANIPATAAEHPVTPSAPPPVAEKPPAVVATPPVRSSHVPVPEKEITIRSLEDLRALTQELDKAKAQR